MPLGDDALLNAINTFKTRQGAKPQDERHVEVEEDHTKDLVDALHALGEVELLVGIPAKNNARDDTPLGNAGLGYIHEFGSPLNNIPPRPFLVPGVVGSRADWEPYLEKAAVAALDFDTHAMMNALNSAGMIAANAVQTRIQDGIPPLLKRPRYKKGRKPQPPNEATPLYDTGKLLASITYVIERKSNG